MALKQPQRKAEMATKLMTEDRLKLHSNKEKRKQNSKILTVTWFFSSIQEAIGFEIQLMDIPNMVTLRQSRPVWNGFCMIHELTGKQSVNRKN